MIVKTMSLLMVASLSLFAADAVKPPVAKPLKEKAAIAEKAPAPVAATVAKPATPAPVANSASSQININTASEAELQKLHGVGAAKAKAIVDYRKAHGAFKNPTDLTAVPGIGDKIFADIKSNVKVR
jgi:competence protein ComEA